MNYQAFLSGGSLLHIPDTATQDDKDAFGAALRIANAQRAAGKGNYVHAQVKGIAASLGLNYQGQGIDLEHLKSKIWLEVQKTDMWEQHSAGAFLAQVWRAIQY